MNGMTMRRFSCCITLNLLLVLAGSVEAGSAEATKLADAICDAAGFTGGLIVHLDCNDGQLTAALKVNDRTIVHGLDTDTADVASARKHIRSLGVYGPVSVEHWEGTDLPYADRMVNLVVMRDAGCKIRDQEIRRVLVPGGAAVFLNQQSEIGDRK